MYTSLLGVAALTPFNIAIGVVAAGLVVATTLFIRKRRTGLGSREPSQFSKVIQGVTNKFKRPNTALVAEPA